MGFFSELKEDLSQAVNELLPDGEEKAEKPAAEEITEEPEVLQEEVKPIPSDAKSLEEMLENMDTEELFAGIREEAGEDFFDEEAELPELEADSYFSQTLKAAVEEQMSNQEEALSAEKAGIIEDMEESNSDTTEIMKETAEAGPVMEDVTEEKPKEESLDDFLAAALGSLPLEPEAVSYEAPLEPEEQPDENPEEQPGEVTGENPEEQPGEVPGEQPGEVPGEQPGEIPEEQPDEIPEEQPGEVPEEQPGEVPEEQPDEVPEEQPDEEPVETVEAVQAAETAEAIAEEINSLEEAVQIIEKNEEKVEEEEKMNMDMLPEDGVLMEDTNLESNENTLEEIGGFEMDSQLENKTVVDETAVITAGMTINGDMVSEGSVEVIGNVIGNIEILGKLNITGSIQGNSKAAEVYAENAKITGEIVSEGSVKIGQSSVIIGNISATSAVIAGAVKGDIDVHGPVILDTSAIVMGNIKSKSVQINNGAVIEGMCSQCYADVNPTSFFDDFKKSKNK